MAHPDQNSPPDGSLRHRAERVIQRTAHEIADMSAVDMQRLVYDLQVHQVELELQNEELRETQRALTAAHERYRQLYNLAPVGYLTLDDRGLIQEANQMASALFEVPISNLVGQYVQAFLRLEDADRLSLHIRELRSSGVHQINDVHLDLPSQVFRMLRLDIMPVQEQGGEPGLYRMTLVDITDRIRAEAEQRRLEALQRQRQVRKLESLGTLAGGIAHEFNNILTIISLYLRLVQDHIASDSPLQFYLEQLNTAAGRAKNIVQQILAFSRQGESKCTPVNLATLVKSSVEFIRATLPKTIDLRLAIVKEQGVVWADEIQIHQVLLNLCANAEYAMRDTIGLLHIGLTSVEVKAGASGAPHLKPGAYVCLSVNNSGPTIPEEVQARLFEPFFTTKPVGEGTGMGLAIVHGIVTDHGGVITVDSTPDHGTTFSLYLPCYVASSAKHIETPATRAEGEGRILLVDDEPSLAMGLETVLRRHGYDVVAYTDPLQALRHFASDSRSFDVIITDQTMPGMTGETLARSMRRVRPDVPIILCTGFNHAMNDRKAQQPEIDAFCMKPIDMQELLEKIQNVLACYCGRHQIV